MVRATAASLVVAVAGLFCLFSSPVASYAHDPVNVRHQAVELHGPNATDVMTVSGGRASVNVAGTVSVSPDLAVSVKNFPQSQTVDIRSMPSVSCSNCAGSGAAAGSVTVEAVGSDFLGFTTDILQAMFFLWSVSFAVIGAAALKYLVSK